MVTVSASQIQLVMLGQIGEPTNINWASWGCNYMRCIRIAPKLENLPAHDNCDNCAEIFLDRKTIATPTSKIHGDWRM